MSECDEAIIAEIISDFSIAINQRDIIRAYRVLKILDDYLKGKKCDNVIKERALRIINSLDAQVDEKFKKVIEDARKILLKRRRVKSKGKSRKSSKVTSRRSRRRRKH